MTAPRDVDSWLPTWMAEAAGQPPTDERIARLTTAIQRRGPRPTWLARAHDHWAHGAGGSAGQGGRVGLVAIAAVTMLALVGLVIQLTPGGPPDQNVIGPVTPSPALPTTSVLASPPPTSPSPRATRSPAEVGQLCRPSAPPILPRGPLPVTSRPLDLPANDGYLAITGPELIDPTTGASVAEVALASEGKRLSLETMPLHWSPDGRWLALRWGYGTACGGEIIYSSDGTRAVDVTDYPPGRMASDLAWSPDGRWLAVVSGDRVDVFGISVEGIVSDARTVWQAAGRQWRTAGARVRAGLGP